MIGDGCGGNVFEYHNIENALAIFKGCPAWEQEPEQKQEGFEESKTGQHAR